MRAVISVLLAAALVFAAPSGAARGQDQQALEQFNHKIEALHAEGNDAAALPLAEEYVALARERFGESDPETATAVTWLATLYQAQGRVDEAEALYKQALEIRERTLGDDHALTATSLANLASFYQSQGRQADADPLMQRAAAVRDKAEGGDGLEALGRQAQELQWNGNSDAALALAELYVAGVRERYGEEHPDYATAISLLASIYQAQGRTDDALALYRQALTIREAALPPKDPRIVASLNSLAALLQSAGRTAEAELVLQRVREIQAGRRPSSQFAVALIPSYAVVKVYYATDRRRIPDADPAGTYGGDRGELSLGICTVSIPRDHRMGALEAPSIWRLEWSEDPEHHVVLLSVAEKDKQSFFDEVSARVAASGGKSAFIFVHGYNVTFADAARRTAQMAYDLGFDGAPVFYSWPSQASYAAYHVDETNAEWSELDFKNFLKDFADSSGADSIFLIAHSMGNRVLTGALKELLQEHPDVRAKLKEIILAAPDIDADTFKRDIAPRILPPMRSATLYASSRDYALTASKHFAGYRRAGDTAGGVTIVEGLDTIDASDIRTDFVGHSYYGDSESVLGDLRNLILDRKRAEERSGLTSVNSADGKYWAFSR